MEIDKPSFNASVDHEPHPSLDDEGAIAAAVVIPDLSANVDVGDEPQHPTIDHEVRNL